MNLLANYEEQFPLIVKALYNAAKYNRLAHAYLLYSDSVNVRENFALAVAQLASCDYRNSEGKACGQCKSCMQIAQNCYAELYHLSPVGKTRQIRVGDNVNPEPNTVRWFENLFYLTNISGSKKIGVISDAERMNKQAQNAFLKTLEEPPADSLFILASANKSMLLPTTISRCQLLTLLENDCQYNFAGKNELFKALSELFFKGQNSIVFAENCSRIINEVANSLKKQVDEIVDNKLKKELEKYDDSLKKSIVERFENQKHAMYLGMRNSFLDAIHTFFAQLYHLSEGCDFKKLANKDVFENLEFDFNDESVTKMLDKKKTFYCMNQAVELIKVLQWQVTESLAYRVFCMKVAFKSHK